MRERRNLRWEEMDKREIELNQLIQHCLSSRIIEPCLKRGRGELSPSPFFVSHCTKQAMVHW